MIVILFLHNITWHAVRHKIIGLVVEAKLVLKIVYIILEEQYVIKRNLTDWTLICCHNIFVIFFLVALLLANLFVDGYK